MSQRVKRPNRSEDGSIPVKRRKRTAAEEEEAASLAAGTWQPRSNDLKSSIYNRTTTEAPAELFRKDLISAMKLPDSEPLASDEYWVIVDQWKQEWERGVQVPVNPDSLPEPSVTVTHCNSFKVRHDFKLPKNKYIRITKDDNFKPEEHEFSTAPAQAEAACSYDLDECDVSWLKILNSERAMGGLGPIFEDQLERVIERFEECCWEKIQSILRNEEGLGIEYDENVICDVCRSPDSEEGNEMVFCDNCNICVHQACYGITQIPEGQWLCCTCNLRKRPECVLCPNKGGAMKCTRSGQKWAHVSCALWIPEVSIGCVEKMEPITKISSIPSSRWALICVLCRERVGACIQCSVKTCKTAYHVTCAFKHGLEMRAIIEDENADDGVKLRSYCEKHSKSSKKEKSICSGSEDDDSKRKKRKDMTSEEKNQARAARLQEIEAEFFKHVSVKDIVSIHLDVDNEGLQYIYNYWKLKRKAGHNKPLLPPKSEDVEFITHKREQADIEKMRMFVQLRQDLERVRNLCYMVSRREKLSRSFFRMREQTFHKQAQVLDSSNTLPTTVIQAVIEANHGPSIYDRLYSHNESEDHTSDFDTILARIAGMNSPAYSGDEKKHEVNGLFKDVKNNPYKKVYFNGSSKRRSGSLYGSGMSSSSSSDERTKVNKDKENRLHSSSEDEKPPVSSLSPRKKSTSPFKKNSTKTADRKKKQIPSRLKLESSSEEDAKPPKKDWGQFSKSRLSQVDRELGESASDSDELMPIRSNKKADNVKSMSSIYSDSDSSDLSAKNDDKSSNATNDSQSKLRTKAAVKQFSHKPSSSKSPNKSSPENKKKLKAEEGGKKETNSKKKDCVPSELIVPQRQAAKKATENLKSTTIARVKEQPSPSEETAKAEEKVEKPVKSPQKLNKPKPTKDNKEPPPKETKKESKSHGDVFDIEKELDKIDSQEILAYVPQRQAAKKAAEHIKSGMGKPVPAAEANVETDKPKKETEQPKVKKESDAKPIKKESEPEKPAKLPEHKRKSSSNSSSSSSSSTSTDSSSSSSTESDEEPAKPQPRSESPFSNPPRETTKRSNANDWPFLDKGSKPAASSSSSDSSDSSPPSSPRKSTPSPPTPPQPKAEPARAQEARQSTAKSHPKSPDKKQPAPAAKREEQPRGGRGRGRAARGRQRSSNAGDRVGDTNVGPGDLPDGKRVDVERERVPSRKGKQPAADDVVDRPEKEAAESSKLLSPVRKTDKKLRGAEETNVSSIEKEILERKAGKERSAKLKSTLDKLLFGAPDKKCDNSERRESEKSVIKTSHAAIPAKVEEKAASRVHSPEKQAKPAAESVPVKPPKPAEREKTSKVADKAKSESDRRSSLEKAIKSIERPLKEQEKPKMEKEPVSPKKSPVKKSPNKSKCLDDIFANKVHQSDAKENKIDFMPKQLKSTQDISIADKIIEDDLKLQKSKDILKPSVNVAVPQFPNFSEKIDANKLQDLIHQNHLSSPIHNAKDIDFDIDSFGDSKDEEIIKGLLPFSANIPIIRGDSKEDSARETLNLVEKLRMGLSKKSTSDAEEVQTLDIDKEPEMPVHISPPVQTRKIPESQLPTVNLAVNKPDNSQMVQDKMYEPNADYRYLSCSANDALVANKNIPIQETSQSLSDHSIPIQGDERWVPPSEPYPNVQSAEPSTYLSDSLPHIDQQYLLQHYTTNTEEHHKSQSALTHLPAQLDVRLQDEPLKNQSPPLHDRRISQTPLIDPASMDCMPSPFPYADIHPQAKWADSAVIPSRRSSSSSAASTSSTCSRKGDQEDDPKLKTDMLMGNQMQMDMNMPPYIEPFPSFSENPQFVSPVSLFHPPINTQIPLPSTGPAMYPPQFGAPFPTPHPIPPMPKPVEDNMPYSSTCTAAFTSSQHNMALTAAMLNLPTTTPKPADPPLEEVAGAATETICGPPESMGAEPVGALLQTAPAPAEVVPAPAQINATPTLPSPKSTASVGKKSPSKPTRTSARVTSQMNKSPNKSPGKSPRQEQAPKQGSGRGRGDSKRGSGKSGASRNNTTQSRGRGRGRGRGRSTHHDHDFMSNIHNKLVGTVYDLDFEDDISNDNMTDLKSMRERRKSVDVHERKYESSFISRHSPQLSPKFSSPSQSAHKSRSYNADLRDLRPPTPIENTQAKDALSNSTANETATPMFVQPVLPGPVDMRTYNSSFDQQSYNDNLLGAFASETTEAQVHDEIDEEFEKELHSALTAKKPEPPPPEISSVKVSLSDTRNQLKFKIKGPIANNYTATVAPLPTTPIVEPAVSNITPNAVANNVINSASASSGTSNLRRMRKKELLRQYWNQEVNQDDPNSNSNMSTVPATPTMNRTIITIPKAVASMTSIPTKEDYRDYQTDDMSDFKHHRKESKSRPGGLSRELKQLDLKHQYLSFDDDAASDRRRSLGSVGSNSGLSASFDSAMSNKRRGRPPRPSSQQVTPKLKIKISSNSIVDKVRPPKKRHSATIAMPSVEDLKRESMKFRKRVMADLKCEKVKKKKRDKGEKRKKRKLKPEVQIISSRNENPTKLIIRFGKKSSDGDGEKRTTNESGAAAAPPSRVKGDEAPGGGPASDNVRGSPPKVTPLKLKLSRCQEGSGYIMKPATSQCGSEATVEEAQAVQPGQPPPLGLPAQRAPPPLPLNEDCEVR